MFHGVCLSQKTHGVSMDRPESIMVHPSKNQNPSNSPTSPAPASRGVPPLGLFHTWLGSPPPQFLVFSPINVKIPGPKWAQRPR